MNAVEACQKACALSADEMALFEFHRESLGVFDQVMRSYPTGMEPWQLRDLIAYHIKASMDLGLHDHAQRLFSAMCAYIDHHPELSISGD
jgi:hypothetical protein